MCLKIIYGSLGVPKSLESECVYSLHSDLLGIPNNQENSFHSVLILVSLVSLSCVVEERPVIISVVPHFVPKSSSKSSRMEMDILVSDLGL